MRYLVGFIGHRGSCGSAQVDTADTNEKQADGNSNTAEPLADTIANEATAVNPALNASPQISSVDTVEGNSTVTVYASGGFDEVTVPPMYDEGEEDYGYEHPEVDPLEDKDREVFGAAGDDANNFEAMDGLGAEDGEEGVGIDDDLEGTEGYSQF